MRSALVLISAALWLAAQPLRAEAGSGAPAVGHWTTWSTRLPPARVVGRDPAWTVSIVRRPVSLMQTGSLPAAGTQPPRLASLTGHELQGIASFYWQDQMTSNGERFDRSALTAAHKTLPFNTRVKVTHVASGRSVVVRINDRGPFKPGRVIDLSEAAASVIGMRGHGLAHVRIEVLN